ncbi:MAG: metallophosphoesterase [Terrimonas sp.]|nr:metallophosphoesterase [Terrimonas sp.]
MRNSPFWWILLAFMVLLDLYVFQAVKLLTQSSGTRTRMIIQVAYWILSLSAILLLILLPYLNFENISRIFRTTVFAIIAGLFFAKLIAAVFFLVDDLRRSVQWVSGKLFFPASANNSMATDNGISRSVFLSWAGMLAGGGLFGTLLYGFGNKYRYEIRRHRLAFNNLPSAFKGMKIIHISDIHSGSFADKAAVSKGVDKIMKEKPDLILFTGDLVNNKAEEMDDYQDLFGRLAAPIGVFSTLGNHDYGDYTHWDSEEEKKNNLERLKQVHAAMGWRLLMDENHTLEKNGQTISLIGVQNISGKSNFRSYGDLSKAYQGAAEHPFKILMSHDPSHWQAEVVQQYKDIDLMLSGHTHGMQFGVEIPGFKWSPVQYVYKQWAGLYESDRQKLYINRGYGFIGYPGRVGILPEITVIELV